MATRKVEFTLPAGWTAPEGKKEGDKVTVLAEIQLKANGRACLTELDEIAMPGYSDSDEPKYKPGMETPPGGGYG